MCVIYFFNQLLLILLRSIYLLLSECHKVQMLSKLNIMNCGERALCLK